MANGENTRLDDTLVQAGWPLFDYAELTTLPQGPGAIRQFPLSTTMVDYLLVDQGQAVGMLVVAPVPAGSTEREQLLTRYSEDTLLPGNPVPFVRFPLPFIYIFDPTSRAIAAFSFKNLLEPDAKIRPVYAVHQPATLKEWLWQAPVGVLPEQCDLLRARLRRMPPLERTRLRDCQFDAITALERSLAEQKQRALIQMATGSGKTFMTVHSVYRLIRFGGAKRILFLVDRAHLGRQAYTEFRQYRPLDDTRTFPELYDVQHVQDNTLRPGAKVCIMTIQRLYAILSGRPTDRQLEEESLFAQIDEGIQQPQPLPPLPYKPDFPIETFDFIVTDECHRSIYTLWRPVLSYFDAFITGLTATPGLRTLAFFNRNMVAEYSYAQAVADGVNVDYRIFRINTRISTEGGVIPAGLIQVRDSLTRVTRSKRLDKDYSYEAAQLNRDVVSPNQIRTILTAYRDNWRSKMFPDRSELPKTLIFAQNDKHAEDIVEAARDVFAQGNDFVRKITYKVTGVRPEDLIGNFRNDYVPRIAVTVDMISTGTDIKALEVLLFMRPVKSLIFFEQMKGRGSRTLSSAELRIVTPDANSKTYFVLVDAVGVTEYLQVDNPPLDRKPSQSFPDVLKEVEEGNAHNDWDDDLVITLAGRLGRMVRRIKPSDEDWTRIQEAANGQDIRTLAEQLVRAVNKDEQVRVARENTRPAAPDDAAIQEARDQLVQQAMQPFTLPDLLTILLESYQREQLIDESSVDEITEQDWSPETKARAEQMINDFYTYMQNNSAKISAFEILLNQGRASFNEIKQLANDIRSTIGLTESRLWQAYEQLDATSGRRGSSEDTLADLVALMRYTLERQSNPGAVLETFEDRVNRNFARWLAEQERQRAQPFTLDQLWWLTQIRDHIATSLNITEKDFDYTPFNQRGSLKAAYDAFNNNLSTVLKDLNERLVA